MPQRLPRLSPIQETLLLTAYCKAVDSRRPAPILGDTMSAGIVDEIDYDFGKFKVPANLVITAALRGKKLDAAVRSFVAAHPAAVVLDLGCGFDTRVFRCDPPEGVDWYDIDFPEIARLRPRFLPERAHTHIVGADLTGEGWLDDVPRDRPAMIVAEGLQPFLAADAFQELARTLTGHFATGELAFNGYTRFAAWSMKYHPTIKAIGVGAGQGFDDPREPESWNARLTLVEEQMLVEAPEVAGFPQPLRAITRLAAHSVIMARQGARVLRYRF
ncbi:class I SAM-dependent methyltransferase [Streptosporangium carneum]|uniref:O-methyltransferase Omt n=1 Tax=Streptosporangium carneum TaxID=47481 RepID=A0A9W6ME39_9ACTN|nr:class I SAM-dependent methyltransferase [Streptosporangium carneum]GLK11154.1 putative O-methyltransferase Omt [Streptosporangium carneum]